MYLSENILHLCCILCCMEDWWWTSTSLIEYWSNTRLSELLRLFAEWCDSRWWAWVQWWTTWLIGEHWSEEQWGVRRLFRLLPILKSHSTRKLHRKPFKVRHYENVHWWIFFLWVCVCFFPFLFLFLCSESVREYYGNRRQARRERWLLFDPRVRNVLLIQSGHKQLWWGSWSYSRIVFFLSCFVVFSSYSNVHISVQIKKYFSSEQQGSNAKNLRCIVSYCLWVKRKYKRIKTLNFETNACQKKATGSASTS